MYVLDSSAIIEIIEQRPKAEKIIKLVGDVPFVTTSVCVQEVLAGAVSERQMFVTESLLSGATVLNHDIYAARQGASIFKTLARTGSKVNQNDVTIAGIIQANNAELVTLDKDFSKIKTLRVKVIE